MGCYCVKNGNNKIIKGNKLSDLRSNVVSIDIKRHKHNEMINKIKKNFFHKIQRKEWITILDFLIYKDLYQAGQLNKFLNTVARSQHILKKFYKNKKSILSQNKSNLSGNSQLINNSQNVTNHYNIMTINNFNNNKLNNQNFKLNLNNLQPNLPSNSNRSKMSEINNFYVPQFMSNLSFDIAEKNNLEQINDTFKEKFRDNFENLDSPYSKQNLGVLMNVPTFKNSEIEIAKNPSPPSINISNFNSNSNLTYNTSIKSNTGVKLFITKVNNPYVDLFSKKEIDFNNENNCKNENESIEQIKFYSNRKLSLDDHHTEKTPSFSQEVLMTLYDEGTISITNITQINFSVNKSVTSVKDLNNIKLKNNYMSNSSLNNNMSNSNKLNSGNFLSVPKKLIRFNSAGSSFKKNNSTFPNENISNNNNIL